MKPIQLIILFHFLPLICTGTQDYQQNFGKANMDELLMSSYDRDKKAEAVVLYDIGNAYFTTADQGFRIVFERSTKIKIFTKAGLNYAEIEIPFYFPKKGVETVYDIEGFTYNLYNGVPRITKFDPENVFEEKQSEHWRLKKFAMPDVKEGSVIEFRYKINSPYYLTMGWDFQRRIPVVYSEFTTRMIPFFEYTYLFQGASKLDILKNYQDNMTQQYGIAKYFEHTYTFGMKNIPAFRYEDYMTSINDYIMKIDFQLAALHYPNGVTQKIKWQSLIQDMLKIKGFGVYMKSLTKNSETLLAGLALRNMTDREKTEAIFRYVVNNFNWDGIEDKVAYKSGKDFLKVKTGNSAELNLFLSALLNSSGIRAYPVLISTRDHGKIPVDYPFLQFLNYVIVMVRLDNQDILMDATEPLSPFGILPARCINERGIIVNKDRVEWTDLVDDNSSELTDSVRINFSSNHDTVLTDHAIRATGHDALRLRRNYANDPGSMETEFLTKGMELDQSFRVTHLKMPENPLLIDFSTASEVETVGDKLLISPFAGLAMKENPLQLPFRSNPMAVNLIYKWSRQFTAIIKIPEGYTYKMQNRDLTIDNELVNILYKMYLRGNTIEIKGSYAFKKPVYFKDEYYEIKDYFNKIVSAFNDPLVLVRE